MRSRIALRHSSPEDIGFLKRVYFSTRTEELAPVPWTPEQKLAFLEFQFTAQDKFYRENYQNISFQIIEIDRQPAGRLYTDRRPNDRELRIVDIALLPEFRNQGFATLLLADLFAEADTLNWTVSIHVEAHNPARRLYQRLGFQHVQDNGLYQLFRRHPNPIAHQPTVIP